MSDSTIENQSPPTTRNHTNARASILRQIGLCNATNKPKIKNPEGYVAAAMRKVGELK